MAKYRLAEAAKEDLISIAQYGDEQFGIAQSDRYREKLKQRFSVLSESPKLYATVDHIRVGYRRSVCGAHSIYYRIGEQDVEIIRVLGRQDPEKQLELFLYTESVACVSGMHPLERDCKLICVSAYR